MKWWGRGGEGGGVGGYPSNLWKNPALGIIVNGLSVRAMHVKAELTCHNMYTYTLSLFTILTTDTPPTQGTSQSCCVGEKRGGGKGEWIRKGHS